jgi:hypothetical protein
MNFSALKSYITRTLLNIPGWKTKRKIVVIESDDWGSIRMASKEAYNILLKSGYPVDQCPYNKNDALESNEDLEMLFEVLSSVKDKNGNPAVVTANSIVANPDFEKIKAGDFREYYYEPFAETLKQYPEHDRVFNLYREGIRNKVFIPQFHSREHLNVSRWMKALQLGDKDTITAFMQNMFSIHTLPKRDNINEYMDSLGYDSPAEKVQLDRVITEGLSLFEKTWGFTSRSFIASCYIWHSDMEKILSDYGVKYIQGMVIQREPVLNSPPSYKKKYHYQGQGNSLGQRYLVRNAFFEPSDFTKFDWVCDCLNRISFAFRWNKPAIISSHRKNFIGFIDPSNRDRNLRLFKILINEILKRWPDTEFMTSVQLGDLMNDNKL